MLGVSIHRLTREQLLACFESALESEGPLHFGYMNVAVSNSAADDPRTASLLNRADTVYVDGAGIRLGCRILGADCPPRNTAADFAPLVLDLCARSGKSVGFLGGSPGAAERLRRGTLGRIPQLRVTFVRDGSENLRDEPVWESELTENPPDLLLVGLGVPRQEEWIEKSRTKYRIGLYWSVGALFEYDGGELSRCPAWMGRTGFEWLYRLITEPRRLWKRYLIGNPRFLLRCLCSRLRGPGVTC
jgi:N-acetylglucosaminyldiphosphoundecaprenol N-acetyl-beta-D-mannosaminyltransferase